MKSQRTLKLNFSKSITEGDQDPYLQSAMNSKDRTGQYSQSIMLSNNNNKKYNIKSMSQHKVQTLPSLQIPITTRNNYSKLIDNNSILSQNKTPQIKSVQQASFYHHSNIYNLKEFKGLQEYNFFDKKQDQRQHQQMLLVREFQQKVAHFLQAQRLKKNQTTRDLSKYFNELLMNNNKHSKGSELKQSTNFKFNEMKDLKDLQISQDFDLNQQQIEDNIFNYMKVTRKGTQQNSMKKNFRVNIFLEDGVESQAIEHSLSYSKLQQFVLKQFEGFLNSEKVDYDQKLKRIADEYLKILDRIEERSFKIIIPKEMQPKLQDYDEYYELDDDYLTKRMKNYHNLEDNILNQIFATNEGDLNKTKKNLSMNLKQNLEKINDENNKHIEEEKIVEVVVEEESREQTPVIVEEQLIIARVQVVEEEYSPNIDFGDKKKKQDQNNNQVQKLPKQKKEKNQKPERQFVPELQNLEEKTNQAREQTINSSHQSLTSRRSKILPEFETHNYKISSRSGQTNIDDPSNRNDSDYYEHLLTERDMHKIIEEESKENVENIENQKEEIEEPNIIKQQNLKEKQNKNQPQQQKRRIINAPDNNKPQTNKKIAKQDQEIKKDEDNNHLKTKWEDNKLQEQTQVRTQSKDINQESQKDKKTLEEIQENKNQQQQDQVLEKNPEINSGFAQYEQYNSDEYDDKNKQKKQKQLQDKKNNKLNNKDTSLQNNDIKNTNTNNKKNKIQLQELELTKQQVNNQNLKNNNQQNNQNEQQNDQNIQNQQQLKDGKKKKQKKSKKDGNDQDSDENDELQDDESGDEGYEEDNDEAQNEDGKNNKKKKKKKQLNNQTPEQLNPNNNTQNKSNQDKVSQQQQQFPGKKSAYMSLLKKDVDLFGSNNLIDALLEAENIYSFNVESYQIKQQIPKVPENLQFPNPQVKNAYQVIFEWQYCLNENLKLDNKHHQEHNKKKDQDSDSDKSFHQNDIKQKGKNISDSSDQ